MNITTYFLPIYSSYWFLSLIFLASGILLQNQAASHNLTQFFIPTALLLVVFAFIKPNKHKIIMISSFIIGASSLLLHTYYLKPPIQQVNAAHIQGKAQETILTGNHFWPYRIKLTITKIDDAKDQNLPIFLYTKKNPHLSCHDIITAKNITVRYPTEKDFWLYLVRQGVIGTAFVPELVFTKLASSSSFFTKLETIQDQLFKNLRKKMPRQTFAFFSSLFIGDKNRVKSTIDQQKDPFKFWGLSHQLARSGLHLLLFIFIWTLLISYLPIPYWIKTSILVILSCCYWLLTPISISFLRAFAVFMFYKLCNMLSLAINPLHLLSIVCFFTLLFNPFHLFFLDFQLSFFLTFCLVWLSQLQLQRKILLAK